MNTCRDILCYWLRRYTKPSIISHPDTLIISGEDAISLVKVSVNQSMTPNEAAVSNCGLLLYIPGDVANVIVVIAAFL